MYDIPLRRLKDTLVVPCCHFLPSWITPNFLTLLAFLAGVLSLATAALSPSPLASYPLFFWLLNRLLDGFDGALARSRGISTSLGGFLDLLSDFIIYSLLPIALAHGQDRRYAASASFEAAASGSPGAVDWRAVAVLEATFHINNFVLFYVGAVAEARGEKELTSVAMRPALIEGFESGLIFTAMYVWPQHMTLLCWGMGLGVVVGTVQRVLFVIPLLRRADLKAAEEKEKGKRQ